MKRAVVFGGGGARGSYQIGVWRALRELEVDYAIVTGSSVGALNAALMVQGEYDAARAMWETITVEDVITRSESQENEPVPLTYLRQGVGRGGLDISPMERRVRAVIDETRIRQSPIGYGLVTTQFPTLKPIQLRKEEIPEGQLLDYMLASSSWFPFFQRRTIDDVDYIDGAYADNLPAGLAVRCGAEEIVAVDLLGTGIVHRFKADIPVRYIRSHWNLGDMMDFSPEHSQWLMTLGYQDGLRAYRRLEGNAYSFWPGETRKNTLRLRSMMKKIRYCTGISLLQWRGQLPRWQHSLAYHHGDQRFLKPQYPICTAGGAVTTAAELAGELLGLPPDQVYRMQGFNHLLLERTWRLEAGGRLAKQEDSMPATRKRTRILMLHLLCQLRKGVACGRLPERFFGMAAVSPVEFAAACYLLALELRYGRGMA